MKKWSFQFSSRVTIEHLNSIEIKSTRVNEPIIDIDHQNNPNGPVRPAGILDQRVEKITVRWQGVSRPIWQDLVYHAIHGVSVKNLNIISIAQRLFIRK